MSTKWCPGYTSDGSAGQAYSEARHPLENDKANFSPGKSQCRECYRAYAADWRARRNVGAPTATRRQTQSRTSLGRAPIVIPDLRTPAKETDENGEKVSDEDLEIGSHAYVPSIEMIETWAAVTASAAAGKPAANLMFLGPKGCGKTEGAYYLAGTVGLPFVKIDAASMTDPESWFGTREVVSQDGVAVTEYHPSTFALMLEQPCVMLIDEVNRAKDSDRNVLLPVFDKTRKVMNPLTGDVISRHPRCFIIMSGNRGLSFTGTYAIDPAFISRSLTVSFDYVDPISEVSIARESTGCDEETAQLFVRFATDTRAKAKIDPDFEPVSTREVIEACELVNRGSSADNAARVVVINAASPEGGAQSVQMQLDAIWAGIRKSTSGPALRACAHEHPWMTNDAGDLLTCIVDVPAITPSDRHGHMANPQHKSAPDASTGKQEVWMSQP